MYYPSNRNVPTRKCWTCNTSKVSILTITTPPCRRVIKSIDVAGTCQGRCSNAFTRVTRLDLDGGKALTTLQEEEGEEISIVVSRWRRLGWWQGKGLWCLGNDAWELKEEERRLGFERGHAAKRCAAPAHVRPPI
jgi:hypothetical protein